MKQEILSSITNDNIEILKCVTKLVHINKKDKILQNSHMYTIDS